MTGAKLRAAKPHDKEMKALESAPDVSSAVGDGYTPTAKEAEALKRPEERLAARPPFPGFTTKMEGGVAKIAIEMSVSTPDPFEDWTDEDLEEALRLLRDELNAGKEAGTGVTEGVGGPN